MDLITRPDQINNDPVILYFPKYVYTVSTIRTIFPQIIFLITTESKPNKPRLFFNVRVISICNIIQVFFFSFVKLVALFL